jgi:hypothetical protein
MHIIFNELEQLKTVLYVTLKLETEVKRFNTHFCIATILFIQVYSTLAVPNAYKC